MLPIRLGVVTAVAALCLWGLFSLLDSLQKPGLLRSQKAVVVKGCDTLDTEEARRECPIYFCEKALIDAKHVPLTAKFEVLSNESDGGVSRIAGHALASSFATRQFECEVHGAKVLAAALIETATPSVVP
jgi:hypothetical protein